DGRISKCAGLVVNPRLPGFKRAFKDGKFDVAHKEWDHFEQELGVGDAKLYSGEAYVGGFSKEKIGDRVYRSTDRGGVYLVQVDPEKPHYGCVMFCPLNVLAAFPKDAAKALEQLS